MSGITEERLTSAGWTRGEIAVAAVATAWVVLAATWAAPSVLIIDGFIYHAMIDAFARDGSLFVGNGFEEYGADPLKLHLLREVDGQLAAQYPGGWGIFAAPAYQAAGLRGVVMINAVASALTLPLIWQAARALFGDRRLAAHAALIYGLATFAVDYAFGVWPHGITTFLVTAALAAVATGWRGGPAAELRGALIAGLALGVGVNFRVDALFAVAPLGIWLLGAGARPHAALGALLAGLVPGLALATAINSAKFGELMPVTYGTDKGAVSFGYYAHLAPVALAVAAASLALGFRRVRAAVYRPRGLALVSLGLLAVLLAVPETREVMSRILVGFRVLVIDFQAHPVPGLGLTVADDGTVTVFGVVKKALLQSLPYATVIIVLLPRLWRGPDRAALALCFLCVAVMMVPFAYGSWHGGAAKNMRYFLNLLPALSILCALALHHLGGMAQSRTPVAPLAIVAIFAAGALYGIVRGYDPGFIAEITLPNAIAAATALLAVLVLAGQGQTRAVAATTLGTVATLGLITAFLSAWAVDLRSSQHQRGINLEMASLTADLPADALVVVDNPKFLDLRLNRPPALTAQTGFHSGEVGDQLARLVERAFAEGRPVFAQGRSAAEQLVAKGASAGLSPRYGIVETLELYRMAPPRGGGGGAP